MQTKWFLLFFIENNTFTNLFTTILKFNLILLVKMFFNKRMSFNKIIYKIHGSNFYLSKMNFYLILWKNNLLKKLSWFVERYFQFELYKLFRFYTKISNLLLKNYNNNNKKPRFQIYLKNKSLEFFLSNFVKKKIFIFTKKKDKILIWWPFRSGSPFWADYQLNRC